MMILLNNTLKGGCTIGMVICSLPSLNIHRAGHLQMHTYRCRKAVFLVSCKEIVRTVLQYVPWDPSTEPVDTSDQHKNHRMGQVGRNHSGSPTFLLEHVAQDCIQMVLQVPSEQLHTL